MKNIKLLLLILVISFLRFTSVEGYSINKNYTCNSGYTICPTGTTAGGVGGGCPGSFSCTGSCGTDLYWNGSSCSAVGTPYYSPNGSDTRYSCSNKPSTTSAYTYTYTGDGNGSNNCPYTSSENCGTDSYSSNGTSCTGVGTGYYSPSGNNTRYTCSNPQGDNASRNYYYTGDGNGTNNCPASSYTDDCGTDQYESSNGTCSSCSTGQYSPNNNNSCSSCTNSPSDNTSRNYYYTSDGNGSNSCGYSYSDRCGTDAYESSNGTCSAVGIGYYSPNSHNTRFNCTPLTSNAYWTTDGNGSNNCNFDCNSGWTKSGSVCVDNTNPVAGPTNKSPSGWTNGNVTVSASCSDGQTGCTSGTFSTVRTVNGAGTLYVYDNAGNSDGTPYNVTNIDKLDPNYNVVYTPSSWTNGNVTVSITCSDAAATASYGSSGCNMVGIASWARVGNTYSRIFTGNTSGSITIRDNAGNTRTASYNIGNIDKTNPVVSATNSSATWVNSNISINLSASDSGVSGLTQARYSWTNSLNATCTSGGTVYTNGTNITKSSNGEQTLYLCARDNAGNTGTWNGIYRLDKIIPTVTDNYAYDNVWNNVGTTITLTPADAAPSSSINITKYCWGTGCNPSGGTTATSIAATGQIDDTLRYQTWDVAGNASTIGSIAVKVDTTNPIVSANNNSLTWENTLLPITLSTTDSGGSGLSYSKYSWNTSDGTCRSTGTSYTNGVIINLPGQGTHTLYLCSRDIAGNSSVSWIGTYKYDSVIPTVTDNYTYDNIWNNVGTTITLTPADAVPSSSINITKYCWGTGCNPSGGTTATSIAATGQIDDTLRYQTWDVAGNASAIGSIAVKVDTTNPTISANNSSSTIWRSNMAMNITLSVSDTGGSGISYRKYSWDSSDAICRASGTTFSNAQNITSATIPGNDQGTHTLYLCTRDIAGNNNQWNGIYKFDDDNPTISDNYIPDNIWTNIGTTITLTPVDPNASSANSISLVQSTRYCWGASCNVSTGNLTSGPGITNIVVGPDVDNTLRYQTWDNAGNTSAVGSIIVKIEDKNPDTTMSFNESGSAVVYTPDSRVNYNVNGVINCSDTLSASNSGCDNSTRQYRVQTSTFTCNTGGTWNNYNGTGIAFNETIGNESVRYVCSRVRDIATNGYVYSPVYTVRTDKDTPDFSDVTNTLPVPVTGSKLLADVHVSTITAVRDGGSPISMIEGYFEDSSTASSYGGLVQSTTDNNAGNAEVLTISADMTNVDLDRHADGYRQYSFKITRVLDEAGNEITDTIGGTNLPHILYYVFANSSTVSDSDGASFAKNDVTINQLDVNHTADGENRLLRLELEDRFGNQIIPAADINREIDFRFDVTNNLKLDQYSTSPSDGVFLDRPSSPGVFSNLLNTTTTLSNESSSDGIYDYDFQVYTPTFLSGATDGRQWANGDMTIHDIDYTIRQTASSYISASHSGSVVFDGGKTDIIFAFKPLYLAEFTGDLSLGIFADTVQSAILTINRAVGSPASISSSSVRLGFGQTNGSSNNIAHPNYDLIYQPNSSAITVTEGHQTTVLPLQDLGTLPSSKNFDVKISHVSGAVNTSLPTYVSSHVRYTVNGHVVSYDTNTVGKTRYVDGTNLINTNQVGLKVLGRIQSKTQADITTGQSGTDLYAVGNNSKAGLRELIRKQAILETKNVSGATAGSVTNITGTTWSNPNGTRLRNNTILYYDVTGSVNKIVDIGSAGDLVAGGVKTIIIKGGNAYIQGNITYSNKSTDMLGLVVLSDDVGIGGNIYLDPSVTHLAGIYYADKALMSYTTADGEIDGSVGTTILKNQFYLYGTLFSENTIGGSIIPKCPYYVTVTCDLNEARKYDLNFLRRYFTYDGPDVDTDKDDVYNAGTSYFSYGNDNFAYPMVIEYNPNIQSTPPPLFENKSEQ